MMGFCRGRFTKSISLIEIYKSWFPLLIGAGQCFMEFSMSQNVFESLLATWAKSKGSLEERSADTQIYDEKEVEAELRGLIEIINSVVKK